MTNTQYGLIQTRGPTHFANHKTLVRYTNDCRGRYPATAYTHNILLHRPRVYAYMPTYSMATYGLHPIRRFAYGIQTRRNAIICRRTGRRDGRPFKLNTRKVN